MSKTSKTTTKSTKNTSKTDAARELREAEAKKAAVELAAKIDTQDFDDEEEVDEDDLGVEPEDVDGSESEDIPGTEDADDDEAAKQERADRGEAELSNEANEGAPQATPTGETKAAAKARGNRKWAIRYLARVARDLVAFTWTKFGEDPNVIAGFAMQLDAVRARLEAKKGGATSAVKAAGALKIGDAVHFTDRQYKELGDDFDLSVTKFAGMQGTKTAKILLADETCIFVKAARVLPGPRPATESSAS